jgi:hypothetical protein
MNHFNERQELTNYPGDGMESFHDEISIDQGKFFWTTN